MSGIEYISCTRCNTEYEPTDILELCPKCGGILDPKYDLHRISESVDREEIEKRLPHSMWRWLEFLPVIEPKNVVSAFEGGTPLFNVKKLGESLGMRNLYVKDETKNPTLTFKDRGASATISKLKELGVKEIGISSEGNAACAFALYSKMAGIVCHAYIPVDANPTKKALLQALGSDLSLVKGTIADAGEKACEDIERNGWYNAATFVTPYRHDGKGTMIMEIIEMLNWETPDVLVYPTGGGVGIVGMWKAAKIFQQLGWIQQLPRIFAVQPENCAPVVRSFLEGKNDISEWNDPQTIAMGLRVPKPLAGKMILKAIRESNGSAVSVSEEDISSMQHRALELEGLILEPSSVAAFAGLSRMIEDGLVDFNDRIVIIATGSGHKTLEYFIQ